MGSSPTVQCVWRSLLVPYWSSLKMVRESPGLLTLRRPSPSCLARIWVDVGQDGLLLQSERSGGALDFSGIAPEFPAEVFSLVSVPVVNEAEYFGIEGFKAIEGVVP